MKESLRHHTASGISYRALYDQAVESFKSTGNTPETLANGTTISGQCTIVYPNADGTFTPVTAECGPSYPDNPTGPVQSITIPRGQGFEQQWGGAPTYQQPVYQQPVYQQQSLVVRHESSLQDQGLEAAGELLMCLAIPTIIYAAGTFFVKVLNTVGDSLE
jgi:hypothetical protein